MQLCQSLMVISLIAAQNDTLLNMFHGSPIHDSVYFYSFVHLLEWATTKQTR